MTRQNVFITAIILTSCLFTSVTANAQGRGGGGGRGGGERGGGERSERPQKEKVNSIQNDDLGFVQTKTLEEIGGYKIGDAARDFELKNVDGELFSMSDIEGAKGYVVVFTCNECQYAKIYEDRLITLHQKYASKGYSVIAINPNFSESNEKENLAAMQKRAEDKAFPFVYLADEDQKISPEFGAVRTPHVFLLDSEMKVQYIGTLDDNAKSPNAVKVSYIEEAIVALEKGKTPFIDVTRAVGCPVTVKE
ncbi:thioredoxin family protein [Brumimicrobium glaciale]|uniref:Thioredoxin family protein n=1 Tax=Brumimicrobium glaciale TaxID=200475 RepID=A0A4Q4KL92_9FLAO|nr:thioredoxin family protein [Brumimicrobium glaciale]RYM32599.1 thioredoxin family protein [Brumimicrobium glaciale]